MLKNLFCILIILCATITSGCKQTHPIAPITTKQERVAYLLALQCWRAEGRLSIQANETINASFTWQQNGDKYRLHFYSAFSSESLTIEGNGDQITAVVNKGEK